MKNVLPYSVSVFLTLALALTLTSCLSGGLGRTTRVPEQEPNNTQDAANAVSVPGAATGVVGKGDDSADWFRIESPMDCVIVAELRNLSPGDRTTKGKDLDRFVVLCNGKEVERGSESRLDPGYTSTLTFHASKGQVFLIAVKPRAQSGTANTPNYTLLVKPK